MRCAALALTILVGAAGCDPGTDLNGRTEPQLLNSSSCPAPTTPPVPAAISSLIRRPSIADGTYILVTGYLCTGFEKSGLYETPSCSSSEESGLWISGISSDVQFSGDRVEIVGMFDSTQRGHLGQWPGTVCVYSIRLTDPDAEPKYLKNSATLKQ